MPRISTFQPGLSIVLHVTAQPRDSEQQIASGG
jgi:hypothetical protein